MAAHFLLSSRARTLTLASVMRMSDDEVEQVFIRLRWANNKGEPHCPHCDCTIVWVCRRPGRAPRWRCKACQRDFSVTSGTLFAFHKMPLRAYLLAIAIFCNEVKGKSMVSARRGAPATEPRLAQSSSDGGSSRPSVHNRFSGH